MQPDGLDYETLRLEGIRLIQKLCGNVWTDFNPHDPGVTILEQIVFALTDLGYKTGFDIEAFLCTPSGRIDYKQEALYTREEVLKQFPVTCDDYEQFFSRELDCTKINFCQSAPGIYDVRIWPKASSPEKLDSLLNRFSALWHDWRNLGEAVENISVEPNGTELSQTRYELLFEPQELEPVLLPSGAACDFMDFFPLIEQFPSIYRYGSSASELKKYLEPIEVLFKTFLQAMQDFAESFSLQAPTADFNHYNRILDQMLAMYGVTFPDDLFLQLRGINPNESEFPILRQRLLQYKICYLMHLPELHLHRCGKWWKLRIEIMLGLTSLKKAPLMRMHVLDGIFTKNAFGKVFIVWSSETPFTNTEEKQKGIERFIRDELPAHLCPVFYWVHTREVLSFIKCRTHILALENWLEEHKGQISEALWL